MTAWAIRSPAGKLLPGTVRETRSDAWAGVGDGVFNETHFDYAMSSGWAAGTARLRRLGYRAVRVEVREASGDWVRHLGTVHVAASRGGRRWCGRRPTIGARLGKGATLWARDPALATCRGCLRCAEHAPKG